VQDRLLPPATTPTASPQAPHSSAPHFPTPSSSASDPRSLLLHHKRMLPRRNAHHGLLDQRKAHCRIHQSRHRSQGSIDRRLSSHDPQSFHRQQRILRRVLLNTQQVLRLLLVDLPSRYSRGNLRNGLRDIGELRFGERLSGRGRTSQRLLSRSPHRLYHPCNIEIHLDLLKKL
jgi:hypothetical protein